MGERLTGGSFVLCGEAVDLQRRVGSVATEPHRVIPAVTDAPLLHADSVVHHAHVVDREHAPVDLTQTRAHSHAEVVCVRPAAVIFFYLNIGGKGRKPLICW